MAKIAWQKQYNGIDWQAKCSKYQILRTAQGFTVVHNGYTLCSYRTLKEAKQFCENALDT